MFRLHNVFSCERNENFVLNAKEERESESGRKITLHITFHFIASIRNNEQQVHFPFVHFSLVAHWFIY